MFALIAVGLALVARSTADGRLPPFWIVLAAVGGCAAVARPLALRERGLPSLLVGLVATQLGLNALFLFAATGRLPHGGAAGWLCCGPGRPIAAGPGLTVPVPDSGVVTVGRGWLAQFVAHLVAVAVCAWWLRAAERRAWAALAQVAGTVQEAARRLLDRLTADRSRSWPAPTVFGSIYPDAYRLAGERLAEACPRRGPPSPATPSEIGLAHT
jgi:hypothetical protein